ncbi:hypothetical protein [Alienimonas chondri]|uniref:ATP-grasp domain-containing protein n=1 Tax=Alienimonas chondri TaxID=2681879 RepID=A0ABX1VB52_9PLAN|nr:hypothetical protein [Alienimonas chondri]NNJ24527.1 hypothetical protein [Alienimonas chondri]
MASPDLLIVGGSARAAAWCAVRAGLQVAALDRYNDLDLLAVADPCFLWDGSDGQVERVVGELGVPWMYVGPLENRPDLIDRCAKLAPLRGNGGETLRAVRDPVRLQQALADAGLPTLEVREEHDPPPMDDTWLLKPRASCGGRDVVVWRAATMNYPARQEPHYFQQLVPDSARATESLVGQVSDGWEEPCRKFTSGLRFSEFPSPPHHDGPLSAIRFGQCVGPAASRLALPPERTVFQTIGEAFSLDGLFGVDFLSFSRPHRPKTGPFKGRLGTKPTLGVLEVNPRWTASMELLPARLLPFETWSGKGLNSSASGPDEGSVHAKRVVYARRTVRVGRLPVYGPTDAFWIADVPAPGSIVHEDEPVCTVFASTPCSPVSSIAPWERLNGTERLHTELDEREKEVRSMLKAEHSGLERWGLQLPV